MTLDTNIVRRHIEVYMASQFPRASAWEKKKLYSDWQHKKRVAHSIVADFSRRVGSPDGKKILEIGFGSGVQLMCFAKAGANVYGVEVSQTLMDIAKDNFACSNIQADIQLYDGIHIPYEKNFFDYAIATSVLEHVTDLENVLKNVHKVLKPGGYFYVSYPNSLWLKETHTGIWFLSYMPRFLAQRVLRIFKRSTLEDWNLHFLTYWSLRHMLKKHHIGFNIMYETHSSHPLKRIIKRMLAWCGIHHSALLRTVMIILVKEK